MDITVALCLLFVVGYNVDSNVYASNVPVTPAQYQVMAGGGFSTNYFKTTKPLSKKYKNKNINDISNAGFKNLRLRSRADLEDLDMAVFLNDLEVVVDKCISKNVAPIISWIHHEAEAFGTEEHRQGYVNWWTQVAERLKYKNYLLSFNLFTELGIDACGNTCEGSLRENTTKYNIWTKDAVNAIRQTQGNNADRILILASPTKTGKGLDLIDETIYSNDPYMMAEWHLYASGPNKKLQNSGQYSQKYWEANGFTIGRQNVDEAFQPALNFTQRTGMLTYFGAWMPQDNTNGDLAQWEVINFARYFVNALCDIPWSLNVLDKYYKTKTSTWLTGDQIIKGQTLNMYTILDGIKQEM